MVYSGIALHAHSQRTGRFYGLRHAVAGSSSHPAESSSFSCGPPVRLQLLSTPPRGDAVTFDYRALAYPDADLHRANVAPSRAHDLQRDALTRSGCRTIYEETASGKSAKRIELEHCRKSLRSGDTRVVWRLDRLGRSLSDLVKIIGDLEREGITFESLSEKIDTGVLPANCSSTFLPRWPSSSAT